MDPSILAGLLSGGTNILGGLINGFFAHNANKSNQRNVDNTNATNLQIANDVNQTQRDMQQEKMAFDVGMWNKQNEYNSPTAQRKRLEEAGFNPWLQGVTTGTATTSPTMSQYTPVAATMSPYQTDPNYMAASIGQVMQGAASLGNIPLFQQQVKSQRLDNETKEINNRYLESMTLKNLKSLDLRNKSLDLDNIAKSLSNKFETETYSSRFEMLQEQIQGLSLSNAMANKQLSFLDQNQKLNVANMTSQLATMAAQRNLTRSQIAKLGREMGIIDLQAKQLGISNRKAEAVFNYEVNQAHWLSLGARWDTEHKKNNRFADNPWQRSFVENPVGYQQVKTFMDVFPGLLKIGQ